MTSRPLTTIAVLGLMAAMFTTFLYLAGINTVADTSTNVMAERVHLQLARSLDEDPTTTRVTMALNGRGIDAPRTYTLRVTPSAAVGRSPAAVNRLLSRGAGIVQGRLGKKKAETHILCIATLPNGGETRVAFLRDTTVSPPALVPVTELGDRKSSAAPR